MNFRDLTADEIEVRVQSIQVKNGEPYGVVLLLYKNARCDMNILDATVGAENWQREHYECKSNLFCRVGIKCAFPQEAKTEWIWKSDCGTESNTEAQKGEASDSFKRACVNWGIGRELYTSPFIWVDAKSCNTYLKGKDKYQNPIFATKDKFEVEKIAIKNKKIVGLAIKNVTTGKRCYVWQP